MYRFTYQILLRWLTFYYMITTISLIRINRRNFPFQNLSLDFEEIFRSNLETLFSHSWDTKKQFGTNEKLSWGCKVGQIRF